MTTISKAQRWKILQLWTKVCKDRGWKSSDRALRLSTIGKILGRDLASLDDVGRLDECTKVMAELEAMLGTSINAGLEAADPSRNRKRNWRWLIVYELLPCLALYEEQPEVYLRTVLEGKSRYRKTDRPETPPQLSDFDERTVQMVFWTISARLNSKRKSSGDSGHDMRTKAGVRCSCAQCRNVAEASEGQLIPHLSTSTDHQPETAELLKEEGNENPF